MKRVLSVIIVLIISIIIVLNFNSAKNDNEEYKEITDYSKIAILVDGVPSTTIPTDKYYFMSNACTGAELKWDVLNKSLKIKGIETQSTSVSCTLNFEELDIDIKVEGVTNFNPTGNLALGSINCGDAEVTYDTKLNINFNTKPTSCTINLGRPAKARILADNTAISDSGINFNSVTGDGFYYTSDTAYGEDSTTIYYFRGRVENNWVSFGGYLWRIVRTTSEGGIKLVYSGDGSSTNSGFINNASLSVFNGSDKSKYHVGYTYNTGLDGYTGAQTNSTIKTVVDNWYNANLKAYESYLSTEAIYCSDRSSERVDGNYIYFPAYDRIAVSPYRPTYACPETNASRYTVSTETGNGYLENPIALLTADEINYAGLRWLTGSLNSYIMDNASNVWWTMSPYSTAFVFYVKSSGYLYDNEVLYYRNRVRPAVSLKPNVIFSGGNGTSENPYIVE